MAKNMLAVHDFLQHKITPALMATKPVCSMDTAHSRSAGDPANISDSAVIDSIASIINTLNDVSALYDRMKWDAQLPKALHTVAGSVGPVQRTLETLQAKPKCIRVDGNVSKSLQECKEGATLLKGILECIAPISHISRCDRYHAVVQERRVRGGGGAVEAIMMGIVEETCFLAENSAADEATRLHVMALRNEMDSLSLVDRSAVFDHLLTAIGARNIGSGSQFSDSVVDTQTSGGFHVGF